MCAKRNDHAGIKSASKIDDLAASRMNPGAAMTTNQGLQISDDQNSLKAGVRGPTLLEDFHFREKIQHFDHERIPERVVHARGAAAHGYFQVYKPLTELTKASIFADPKKQTPIFVRFSTVAGSRGSADTARDVRGFAMKFYTDEGVWDLIGNNIPVFFIQDAIKFPDLIHAVKPEPHNEIPQAQSAHDTFYDFASLTPETSHMLMWVMSDRSIPRSFSMMQGFGIHTFRFINAKGKSRFIKFHLKPIKGMHSLVWDEAQKVAGKDPDFHRKDMFESIERGDFPEWEFGIQVVEEKDEHKFDFDLLDPTKIIPEEIVPVMPIGKMVLNRNPDNYFSETEQVAFHPGHVVPGIDFSNDPLLQGRLFSYLDTQISRVGPNFAQLPINRPTCPFHNNQRDGQGQQLINQGKVAYFPNSLASGCPAHSPEGMAAFSSYAEKMDGEKVRMRSPSFGDHFSQATLFWNSMADWEKRHIVQAFSFELNMVETKAIKQRMLDDILINIHPDLASRIARNIGMSINAKPKAKLHDKSSPALSMDKPAVGIKGRKIAILADEGVDGKQVAKIQQQIKSSGGIPEVIGPFGGTVTDSNGKKIAVDKPAPNAPSVVYDAVIVPAGPDKSVAELKNTLPAMFVAEAFMHAKTVAAIGNGSALLQAAGIIEDEESESTPGVIIGDNAGEVVKNFIEGIKQHRHYDREVDEARGARPLTPLDKK
jgi:catalase